MKKIDKIDKKFEERKKKAEEIDIEKIDLATFLEREDVMRALAYDSYALPILMSRMLRQTWVSNPHEKSDIISEKIRMLPWYPRESVGSDYGSGYMPTFLQLRKQHKRKQEDPDVYWTRIYFASHDNGEFSIERSEMDLKKAESVYRILEKEFELLQSVPSRDEAIYIAQLAGCMVG